ncbi:hypothetical protein HAX54_037764 [Datura stramonium]|uniref:Uncharacterized protein n=1 Tax=Datura stramonium TaxID=4076 RepID=A0ABS8RMQ2_DATST|nr:hypothetical protein [Datura stramonium]
MLVQLTGKSFGIGSVVSKYGGTSASAATQPPVGEMTATCEFYGDVIARSQHCKQSRHLPSEKEALTSVMTMKVWLFAGQCTVKNISKSFEF